MLDAATGHEVFAAVSENLAEPDLGTLDQTYCSMLYAATFGDISTVEPAARAVYSAALSLDDPLRAVMAMRHSAVALRTAGFVEDSLDLLCEAYELAKRKGLNTAARSVASTLEGAFLALGDFERSEQWARWAENCSPADEDRVSSTQHFAAQARWALLRGQYVDAERLLERARAVLRDNGSARARMFSFALGIRIKQESTHCLIDDSELRQLIHWHLHARSLGGHDVVMEALYAALRDRSPDAAHQYYEEYVSTFRRERDPVTYSLSLLVGDRRRVSTTRPDGLTRSALLEA
jgi:hypothetical protein